MCVAAKAWHKAAKGKRVETGIDILLEPERPEAGGVTRQGVVLTDLQSLLYCQ